MERDDWTAHERAGKRISSYFGHSGVEQHNPFPKICSLPMLRGYSPGALRGYGDFNRTGTPCNYPLAGGIGVPGVLMAKITPADFCFSDFFCGHVESTKCRSFWSSCQTMPFGVA